MKKNLLNYCLLGVSVLFGLLIFVFMACPGIKQTLLGTSSISVYEAMEDAGAFVAGFVLMILVLVASIALLALLVLNDMKVIKFQLPFDQFIALAFALMAVVAMVLFFCGKSSYLDGNSNEYIHLGVGAVFCALSSLFAGAGLGAYGALKIMNK